MSLKKPSFSFHLGGYHYYQYLFKLVFQGKECYLVRWCLYTVYLLVTFLFCLIFFVEVKKSMHL